jgi:hypothetical protein
MEKRKTKELLACGNYLQSWTRNFIFAFIQLTNIEWNCGIYGIEQLMLIWF